MDFDLGGQNLTVTEVDPAVFAGPISSLAGDALPLSIASSRAACWSVGPLTLQLSPDLQGSIMIRKAGEVLRFTESEKDDDPQKRQVVTVPPGSAYVSLSLRVSIALTAGGAYSNGALGVKGSAAATDTFLLANHIQVSVDETVGAAVAEVFARFVMPFRDSAYRDIREGDFVEYQFYGKLNIALTSTLGFGGVLFGGLSGGDLQRTVSSEIGSVTAKAAPAWDLSAEFSIRYQHEDAFRIVLSGLAGRSRLYLFKMDDSRFSTALKVNAGVSANASVSLRANIDALIPRAAQDLFADVAEEARRRKLIDDFTARVLAAPSAVDGYVKEAEQKVREQIQKLDRLKVTAAVAYERISEHATLLSIEFDRGGAEVAYRTALGGDLAGAIGAGAQVAPGSYTRSEIRRTTSLKFQLFGAFEASSFETYFQKAQILYAGNGVFQLRWSAGVSAGSKVFGHGKAIEFYFEISASATPGGTISDKDIQLHVHTTDQNHPDAVKRSAAMLRLILDGTAYSGLHAFVMRNPHATVDVSLVVGEGAYRRVRFSLFDGKKPPRDQSDDARNYAAFVSAVDAIYDGAFPDSVARYQEWAHYNVTAIDEESSTKPANRREVGNANTMSVWPQDSARFPAANAPPGVRPMMRAFMMAAQAFLNLCEDLPHLASDLDAAATQALMKSVVKEAEALVKDADGAFPLFFTKPLAAALIAQSAAQVKSVQFTGGDTVRVVVELG